MNLNFKSEQYLTKALQGACHPESCHSLEEVFMFLIKDVPAETLRNYMSRLKKKYPSLTEEEIYALLQGADISRAADLMKTAYECLDAGESLGSDGVGEWIGHCLLEGKVLSQLAEIFSLDPVKAWKLGMLHDVGRKLDQSFLHTVRGFELLTDAGFDAEALGCLTHSFIGQGRCATNDPAEPGFYLNDEGEACWEENAYMDDVSRFLQVYQYTEYDHLLNLADLISPSRHVMSPKDRVADIGTRKPPDPVNRNYFLAQFINLLNERYARMTGSAMPEKIRASKDKTDEEMYKLFEDASDRFYNAFLKAIG